MTPRERRGFDIRRLLVPVGLRRAIAAGAAFAIAVVSFAHAGPDAEGMVAFTVNSTADIPDQTIGDGFCDTGNFIGPDPECTLRAAIQEANASATDAITLPAGLFTLAIPGASDDASSGDLDITQTLTLTGAGAATTTVDGADLDRVFHVVGATTVTLTGLTAQNGTSVVNGGGILNEGTLTLDDVVVRDNQASGGGGIRNNGTLNLSDVEVRNNIATADGGGLSNAGSVTWTRGTLANNSASNGGGIRNTNGATSLNLTNVTISTNDVGTGNGAGLYTDRPATLLNVTIANNTGTGSGSAIHTAGPGSASLTNTLVAGNVCSSSVGVSGGNLESPGNTCGLETFNVAAGALNLGALGDNGGPTRTHALVSPSAAIDAGIDLGAPPVDQRGDARPTDGDGDATATTDVGAYEAPTFAPPPNSPPVAVDDAYTVAEGGTLTTVAGPWHLPGWGARRSVTFNNLGRGQLDDFPVLLALDSSDIDYSRVQSLGQDLRLVDGDGTPLAHEIEAWNPGGTSYVWVKVPQIDAGSTSDFIWMYYGNDSAGDGQAPASVWSNGYVGVWHMNQDPAASQILDSTSYLNHGTPFNMDASNLQPGRIGSGLFFDGSATPNTEYIRVPSNATDELAIAGSNLTLEAWVERAGTTGSWMVIVGRQIGTMSGDSYMLVTKFDEPSRLHMVTGGDVLAETLPAAIPVDANWHYAAGVLQGDTMNLYTDGSPDGSIPSGVLPIATDANDVTIGAAENDGTADPTEPWHGRIDEVRISTFSRSADWVNAQNASMADTFVAYGSTEEPGLLANDSDLDSDPLTVNDEDGVTPGIQPVAGPSNGTLTLNADGSFTYVHDGSPTVSDSFTYRAHDGTDPSNIATVEITITTLQHPYFDPPTTDQVSPIGQPVTLAITASDPQSDPLTYTATGLPAGLSIGLNSGIVSGSPSATGSFVVTVTVDDGAGHTADDVFTWTVIDGFYAVSSTGGVGGGTDLLTLADPANADPVTNEATIGTGLNTSSIRAAATDPYSGIIYAVNADTLGIIDPSTGTWTTSFGPIGTANGAAGPIALNLITGMSFDPATGYLYAVHQTPIANRDLLFRLDVGSGTFVAGAFGGDDYVEIQDDGGRTDSEALAINPITSDAWVVQRKATGDDRVVRISLVTGLTLQSLDPKVNRRYFGLTFDAAGNWFAVGHEELDTTPLLYTLQASSEPSSSVTLDDGSGYQALLQPAAPQPGITGKVFEDVAGDALPGAQTIGDAANPGVSGAMVSVYADDGDLIPDAGDTLVGGVPNPVFTDPNGDYRALGLADGTYFVVVDSASLTPSAGFNPSFTSALAEQTWGPDQRGSFNGSWSWTATAGTHYGGARPDVADQATANPADAEHIARITVAGGVTVTDVDYGFSFNVVTTADGKVGASAEQGSFDRFIQNANAIAGPNAMRFVPAGPTNSTGGTPVGDWWTVTTTGSFTNVNDADTTIDGTAYDSAGLVRTDNPGFLGANAAGGVTVGVDDVAIGQVERPELELSGDGLVIANGAGLRPDNAIVRDIGIVDSNGRGIDVIGLPGDEILNVQISQAVIGSSAGEFVAPATPTVTRGVGSDYLIGGSLTDSASGFGTERAVQLNHTSSFTITGNELRAGNLDTVDIDDTSDNVLLERNLVADGGDFGLDIFGTDHTIRNNTIEGHGTDTGQQGGVRLTAQRILVEKNVIRDNTGPGILVAGDWIDGPRPAGVDNEITLNSISNNTGLGIDLVVATDAATIALRETGDGVTANGGHPDATHGNRELGHPVIATAGVVGSTTRLIGTAPAGARIEFFTAATDPSGYGEGSQHVVTFVEGSVDDADPTAGAYDFTHGSVVTGDVTATATLESPVGIFNTSEFGNTVTVSYVPGSIGDLVWKDTDEDGIKDGGESAFVGLTVNLYSPGPDLTLGTVDDVLEGSDVTDAAGAYVFTGLAPGAYRVEVDMTGDPYWHLTTVANPHDVTIGSGDSLTDIDFGFDQNSTAQAWHDADPEGGVLPGQTITYVREYTRTGDTPTTGVGVDNPLPAGTTYVPGSTVVEILPVPSFYDRFAAQHYNNSNSTGTFAGPWQEVGEPTDPTAGDWYLVPDALGWQLEKSGAAGTAIERLVTTDPWDSGWFTMTYQRTNVPAGAQIEVQISSNGLAGPWTTIAVVDGVGAGITDPSFINLNAVNVTPYLTGNTAIRFEHVGLDLPVGAFVNLDFVRVSVEGTPILSMLGSPPPTLTSGHTINRGEKIRVTFQVTVDDPATVTDVTSTGTILRDGGDWALAADVNPVVSVAPDSGSLVINEVNYTAAPGMGANVQFVELHNNSASTIDISNWYLANGWSNFEHTFAASRLLAAGEYAVVWIGAAGSAPGAAIEVHLGNNLQLTPGGDSVWLWDQNGDLVDAMAWGSGSSSPIVATQWDATHQASLGGAAASQSISLTPNGVDGNSAECWEATTSDDASGRCAGHVTTADTDAGSPVWSVGDDNNTGVNQAPVLDPVANQSVDELALLAFTATATDPNSGDTLTFTLVDGTDPVPAGAAITAGGNFTWTPTEAQGPGTYSFKVRVTDQGALFDEQEFTITVNEVNAAPNVTNPGAQSDAENDVVSLFIVADDSSDIPPNGLSYSATGLPDGLTINIGTGEIAGTITYDAAASSPYSTVVTVTDDGTPIESTQVAFTWTVANTNRPPVANAESYSTDEDIDLIVGVVAGVLANDTDPDLDTLQAFVDTPPTKGSLSLNTDGSFTYDPNPDAVGADSFVYRVEDGNMGSDTAIVSLTIDAVNDEPSFVPGANQNSLETAGAVTLAGWATAMSPGGGSDESGQTLAFTVTNDNNALFTVQPAVDAVSGDLTYTVEGDNVGVANVTVSLSDNGGTANGGDDTFPDQVFTITIDPVNDAPVFTAGANESVPQDSPAQTVPAWATGISPGGGTDEAGQILTFNVTNDNTTLFSVQPAVDATTGDLTYTPAPGAVGIANVDVNLSDDGGTANGGTDTSPDQSFTIELTNVNDPPTLDPVADQNVDELALLSFTATASDPDVPETLTFSLLDGTDTVPAGAAITAGGDFTWTPTEAQGPASYSFKIRVTDALGLWDEQEFTITVAEVNAAPNVTNPGAQSSAENDVISLAIVADDSTDVPANVLSYSATGLPDGLSINPTTGEISGTITYDAAASSPFSAVVTVTDDGTPAEATQVAFTWTVANTNRAPVVTASADQTANEGTIVSIAPTFTDADLPADSHTATIDWGDGSPDTVIDPATSPLAANHVYADDGAYVVTITVEDAALDTGADTLTVTVDNVNPVVAAGADQTGIAEGATVNIAPTFSDAGSADTHSATISWGDGSPDTVVNPATSPIAANHVYADNGTYTVTVTVTDDDGGSHADALDVTVDNVAPVVTAGADQTGIAEGATVNISPTFSDAGSADTHSATISWGDGSPDTVVNPATSPIAANHVYADNGSYVVTVTVTDDDSGSHADTLTVTVDNVAPVVAAGADQTGTAEGATVNISPTFSDAGSADTHAAVIDWGDGTPDTVISPATSPLAANHVYADNGVYTVTVTVTDDDLTSGADTLSVTVDNVAPVVVAGPDQTGVNEGDTVSISPTFTDAGSGDTHTATIDWGDGSPLDVVNPATSPMAANHVYADNGVYTVTVTVDDDDAGSHADSLTVTVDNVAPVVVAGADQGASAGNPVSLDPATFTDAGSADTHTATIDWGDGSPLDVGTVDQALDTVAGSHTYATSGSYIVTVTVTDDDGGSHADTLTVTVGNSLPVVNAGADQSGVAEGATVDLDPATFTDADGADTHTATIDWGDGSPVDVGVVDQALDTVSGSHAYPDNGVYTVTVTVTDSSSGSSADSLTVTVDNVAPVVVAGADQGTSAGTPVSLDPATFTDAGSADTHTATIDWGDGSPVVPGVVDQALDTVSGSHTYATSGSYTVTVTVVDDDGGSHADTFLVTVGNSLPVVNAGADQTGVPEGSTVSLDPATFSDADAADTHTATVDWGDGSPLDVGTVDQVLDTVSGSHGYADNGTYTVTVTVTDSSSGSSSDAFAVTVDNVAPVVVAGADQAVDEGATVSIAPTFTDAGSADTHSATVDWGDGSPVTSIDPATSPLADSHVYADNGTYTVTVTVTDDDGGSHADTLAVTVNNADPVVVAGADQTVDEGATVSIAPTFTDAGSADTHTATVDWGDGSPVTSIDPATSPLADSHVYADNGTYTVTVTVTDDDGGSHADTLTVTVANADPVVTAGADQTVDEGDVVSIAPTFIDPGPADTHTATIDWGDGSPITSIDPATSPLSASHVYADNGAYTVTVTVYDDDAGTHLDALTVTVMNADPGVNAGVDQSGIPEGTTVSISPTFTDPGGADTHTATIDWGDGSPVTNVDPATSPIAAGHVYVDEGLYTVTVTVTDDDGGTGTDTLAVIVDNAAPVVAAGPDQGGITEGATVIIAPTFTDAGATDTHAATIDWGDGSPADGINPATSPLAGSHAYADNGTYTVTVTVTDNDGGTDVDSLTITVDNAAPAVVAGADQSGITEGATVSIAPTFSDTGSADTHTATVDWGDGSPVTTIDPATSPISASHVYADDGTYTVTITVADDDAGSHSDTLTVGVDNADPVADAGLDETVDEGNPFNLAGTFVDPGAGDTHVATIDWGDGSPVESGTVDEVADTVAGTHVFPSVGIHTVTLTVVDDDGGTHSDTVEVTVANLPPVLDPIPAAAVDEDTELTFTATATDAPLPGNTITFSLSGAPAGAAIDAGTGKFTWTPTEADGPGTFAFEVVASDAFGGSDQQTVSVTVGEVNAAPTIAAVADVAVSETDSLGITVTAGDSDLPANKLAFSAAGLPAGVAIDPATGAIAGSLDYSSAGMYTVVVTVVDDGSPSLSAKTTFVIAVADLNRPPSLDPLEIAAAAGVATPFTVVGSDPDGDALIYTVVAAPTQGTVAVNGPEFTYTPGIDAGGTDTFQIVADDGTDTSEPVTVTVVIAANGVPAAAADTFIVDQARTLDVGTPGVLRNDVDPEGAPLRALLVDGPRNGELTLRSDGSFTYIHDGRSSNRDTFTYRVSDGERISAPATVTISINPNLPPEPRNDRVVLDEDDTVVFSPLNNDSDPDGDEMAISSIEAPTIGVLFPIAGAAYRYIPEPDWNGTIELTYEVVDARGAVATALVTIEVRPVNDTPQAEDVVAALPAELLELGISIDGKFLDVDGDVLTVDLGEPAHGTAVLVSNGLIRYIPEPGFEGIDSFVYTVIDAAGATAVGTITVDVATIAGEDIAIGLVEFDRPTAAGRLLEETGDGILSLLGLRLVVGSVFETFYVFRLPLLVLAGAFLVSLLIGLSKGFVFGAGPVFLPLIPPGLYSVVLVDAAGEVLVRAEPGDNNEVIHKFGAAEKDLRGTGRRAQTGSVLWIEVETPAGDGWIEASVLTPNRTAGSFAGDDAVYELAAALDATLADGGDLTTVTGGEGIHIAHFASPEHISADELPGMLADRSIYAWWSPSGSIPELDGTFAEIIAEPLSAAMKRYEPRANGESFTEIPVEFVNYQRLTYGDETVPGKDAWHVFFDHVDGEPHIAAIWREGLANSNAVGNAKSRRLLSAG